jgi:hypothetical protein
MTMVVSQCPLCPTLVRSEQKSRGERRGNYSVHLAKIHAGLSLFERSRFADEMARDEHPAESDPSGDDPSEGVEPRTEGDGPNGGPSA